MSSLNFGENFIYQCSKIGHSILLCALKYAVFNLENTANWIDARVDLRLVIFITGLCFENSSDIRLGTANELCAL